MAKPIKQTKWYKKLKKETGSGVLKTCLDIVSSDNFKVIVLFTEDLEEPGFCIIPDLPDSVLSEFYPEEEGDFWLDWYETLEEAMAICNDAGWEFKVVDYRYEDHSL